MTNRKLLLYDADYLCYKHGPKDTLQEAIDKVDNHLDSIFKFTEANGYILFISEGKYFRHYLAASKRDSDPKYKEGRNYSLPWIKTIKEYLKSQYKAISYYQAEADDAVAYFNKKEFVYYKNGANIHIEQKLDGMLTKNLLGEKFKFEPVETIPVSCDKDINGSMVGRCVNPSKKNKDSKEYESIWITNTKEDVDNFFKFQLIQGDTQDKIISPFPENCAKDNVYNKQISLESILYGYINGMDYETPSRMKKHIDGLGQNEGVYKFGLNYRLLKMLENDEDWMREVGYIPIISDIQTIDNDSINLPKINLELEDL